MKKVLLSLAICLTALSGFSQSVSLPQANVTPAPLPSVGNDGVGVGVFTFAESSGIPVQATAFGMPNVTISVNLQYVELTDGEISKKVEAIFDMRPYFIEQRLKLRSPIYSETAAYGHMGRTPEIKTVTFTNPMGETVSEEVETFTWEKLDYVDKIKTKFNI